MADLKVVNIDLTGGVVTDAEAPDIGTQIADSENLVKPVGGSPRGLRVRPGVSYFDRIASANPATEGVAPFVCTLDPEDGFPGGSYVTALVDRTTGEILEMSWGIETRGEPAPDETYESEPEPDEVAVLISWAEAEDDDNGYDVGVIVTYSPSAEVFRYYYITDEHGSCLGLSGAQTADGLFVAANNNGSSDSVSIYDLAAMIRGNAAAMYGVVPPPANINALPKTAALHSRALGKNNVYHIGSGGEWVSRGGVHYVFRLNTNTATIYRTNVQTGADLGDVTVTLETDGGTINGGPPWSRPDADGYVIAIYQANDTNRWWLAKVDPSTGDVAATLEITNVISPATVGGAIVIPLSSGGYFLHVEQGSGTGLDSRFFHIPADLSGATEILAGRSNGTRVSPLVNCGGVNDTVFLCDLSSSPNAANGNLLRLEAVSTSPALIDTGQILPPWQAGFWIDLGEMRLNHCRIDDNTMMWGVFSKVNLTTGAVTFLTVEDEYGLQNYDTYVPGGFNFGWARLCPDPFRYLQAREGYREEV